MVGILAIQVFHVQAHTAIACHRLEEFLEQLCVHIADLVANKINLPDQVGTFAQVYSRAAQRFIHWQIGVAITGNPGKIAQRLGNRLANNDAGIFNRVVAINVQVALGADMQVDEGVAPERVQHMVKKANARFDISLAGPIEIEGHGDIGFLGFSRNRGCSIGHGASDRDKIQFRLAQFCSPLPKQSKSINSLRRRIAEQGCRLKPIKSIRRIWARASFAKVIPSAAFILAVILASSFSVFHHIRAHQAFSAQMSALSDRISDTVAADIASGNLVSADLLLDSLAPGKAMVVDANGQRLAGRLDRDLAGKRRTRPVESNGRQVGELITYPLTTFQPPMPWAMSVLSVLMIAGLAAWVMRFLSLLASNYLDQVTELVNDFSLKNSNEYRQNNLVFAEFRRLNVAAIRTTRRLVREIRSLKENAQYDIRTGLLNERALQNQIEKTLERVRYDRPAALIVIELNDSGRFSEKMANNYSDLTLQEIAKIFKNVLNTAERKRGLAPGTWPLAALFSNQFAILVQDFTARDELASLIRELQMAFRNPIKTTDTPITISLSGSIVVIPEDGDSVAQIMQRAAATILDLKRQEKKGFSFYSPKLERQRDALVKLESELRVAVEKDRFVPLFQPKIDLDTGRICGAEALARWQLDSGRLVSPSVFIELAEETGLINAIGEQIMRKACLETAQWNQLGHRLNIAVNVSPKQFERDGLARMILDSLAKSGLSPRQLEIEITESLAIQQPERVRSVLKPLRKLGIKLAVDDFGTGHSNLATLTQLDFDVFKIDRQFVAGTPHDGQANAIVEMILSMARTLEMQIVGEGIETEMQAKFLKLKGCHIAQGYLYSPPVTAEAFRKLLSQQPFTSARMIA